MRPPYPVEIVPLLPEFLGRRRSKLTFALAKSEELGLDRPSFIWAINLSYRGERGAGPEPGDLMSAYGTIPNRWLPMAAAARGAGLAEERGGRWYLTQSGWGLARAMHAAARAHYAQLAPLPRDQLTELARLLDQAFHAGARAGEPSLRMHTPFAFAYRMDEPEVGSFSQLDAAIYGLWQVRDDCHFAAWRSAGLSGPDLEVLTRVWRHEAEDAAALAELLPHQRAEDVNGSLARLRDRGLIWKERLETTSEGTRLRARIEEETDRLFFAPWPDEVGSRGAWIAGRLGEVNAALA